MVNEAQKILIQAADWLEDHDWCQGDYWYDKYGISTEISVKAVSACSIGAFVLAAPDQRSQMAAYIAMCNHLGVIYLSEWNDRAGRTKQQVVEAMRSAASNLQEVARAD